MRHSCSRRHRRTHRFLGHQLKLPEPRDSGTANQLQKQQHHGWLRLSESLCGMKDSYNFQQGIWRYLKLCCISQKQLLALHLLPLLKVTGVSLSCPQSLFPPCSTSGSHRAPCEIGTKPWQSPLSFKINCHFYSIPCNTDSWNFRRGCRPRTVP